MSDFIIVENYGLTVSHFTEAGRAAYSLEAASNLTGVHPDMLRYYCRAGLLGDYYAALTVDPTFDDDALYEVRRIEHYRRDQGVNLHALPVICALQREVEQLRAELRFLRGP
jgi:DNA-binding transcriptional MerR regulator